jgi:hypothetical protein
MVNNQNIDEKIAKLVQSRETEIPVQVEEKIRAKAVTIRPARKIRVKPRPLFIGIMTSAAMILFAFLILFPMLQKRREPQIAEIRTEFELRDKNIKIIFIQRSDFNLFEEER